MKCLSVNCQNRSRNGERPGMCEECWTWALGLTDATPITLPKAEQGRLL